MSWRGKSSSSSSAVLFYDWKDKKKKKRRKEKMHLPLVKILTLNHIKTALFFRPFLMHLLAFQFRRVFCFFKRNKREQHAIFLIHKPCHLPDKQHKNQNDRCTICYVLRKWQALPPLFYFDLLFIHHRWQLFPQILSFRKWKRAIKNEIDFENCCWHVEERPFSE